MKKVVYIPFFLFALNLLVSAQKNDKPAPYELLSAKAGWLIGQWGFTSPEGSLTETWTIKNDSTYAGQTYFVIGKDTVFSENITIEQRGRELNYVTVMKDQNQGKPVAFKLTASTSKELVFENPTHDFPQKITYTRTGKKSLVAKISGNDKGKPAEEKFEMKKLK